MWQAVPFIALTLYAAQTQVAQEYIEAARLDGANEWRIYWNVTIPFLRPTLMLMTILSVIWDFNVFNQIWLITQGGPNDATMTLGVYTYMNAFVSFDLGNGAAIAIVTTLILGAASPRSTFEACCDRGKTCDNANDLHFGDHQRVGAPGAATPRVVAGLGRDDHRDRLQRRLVLPGLLDGQHRAQAAVGSDDADAAVLPVCIRASRTSSTRSHRLDFLDNLRSSVLVVVGIRRRLRHHRILRRPRR